MRQPGYLLRQHCLIDMLSFLSFNTPVPLLSCQHPLRVSCSVFSHLYQYRYSPHLPNWFCGPLWCQLTSRLQAGVLLWI